MQTTADLQILVIPAKKKMKNSKSKYIDGPVICGSPRNGYAMFEFPAKCAFGYSCKSCCVVDCVDRERAQANG